jgi:hypothetical protein
MDDTLGFKAVESEDTGGFKRVDDTEGFTAVQEPSFDGSHLYDKKLSDDAGFLTRLGNFTKSFAMSPISMGVGAGKTIGQSQQAKGVAQGFLGVAKSTSGLAVVAGENLKETPEAGIANPFMAMASKMFLTEERKAELKELGYEDPVLRQIESLGDRLVEFGDAGSKFFGDLQQHESIKLDPKIFAGDFLDNPSWTRATTVIAQAIPSLAAAFAVSASTGNPLLGASYLGLIDAESTYDQARKAGLPQSKRNALFAANAAGSTALEYIPLKGMLKGMSASRIGNVVAGLVMEGGQEGAQQLWQNLIVKYGIDKTRGLFDGVVESLIAGAGSGAVISSVSPLKKDTAKGFEPDEIDAAIGTVSDAMVQNGSELDKMIAEGIQNTNEVLDQEEIEINAAQELAAKKAEELPEKVGSIRTKLVLPKTMGGLGLSDEDADAQIKLFMAGAKVFSGKQGEDLDTWLNRVNPSLEVGGERVSGDDVLNQSEPLVKTDTPEFKNWFSESKVVDKSGKPLVVSHGGIKAGEIEIFNSDTAGDTTGNNSHGAFHFSDSKQVADDYSRQAFNRRYQDDPEGLVIDGYVKKLPKFKGYEDQYAFVEELAEKQISRSDVYLKIENPIIERKFEGGRIDVLYIERLTNFAKNGVDENGEFEDYYEQVQGKYNEETEEYDEPQKPVDGIIIKDAVDDIGEMSRIAADQFIVFSPEQIKSAIGNRGTFDSGSPNILFQGEIAKMGFFSKLQSVIEEKMGGSATIAQLKGMIVAAGVKQDEIDSSRIMEFFEGKEKVSKREVLDWVMENQIQIDEVTKGGGVRRADLGIVENEDGSETLVDRSSGKDREIFTGSSADVSNKIKQVAAETKFEKYTEDGGENYREVLLTLPERNKLIYTEENVVPLMDHQYLNDHDRFWYFKTPDNTLQILKSKYPSQKDALDYVIREKQPTASPKDNYKGSHFDEKNIVAHFRLNDRKTEKGKTLFIEEIQSDWHQAGKKSGYKGLTDAEKIELDRLTDENLKLFGELKAAAKAEVKYFDDPAFDEIQEKRSAILNKIEALNAKKDRGVPDAPFKKTWHELALKRILRMAVEEGYDSIAWTTGEQQAARYDLSKQISSVEYGINQSGELSVNVYDKKNSSVWGSAKTSPKELEDVIGKELASKISEDIKDKFPPYKSKLSGLDLKVGGEPMKVFYDEILKNFLNKYTKKWGGRVGEVVIDAGLNIEGAALIDELRTGEADSVLTVNNNEQADEIEIMTHDPNTGQIYSNYGFSKDKFDQLVEKIPELKAVYESAEEEMDIEVKNPESLKVSKFKQKTAHSLEITPSMKDAIMQGQALFQGEKGSIKFGDNQTIISLYKNADKSTFLHEVGHLFMREMRAVVDSGKADAQTRSDYQTLIDYVGGDIESREGQEKLARAFEIYLREGKSPVLKLQSAFDKFKEWLTEIYKSLSDLGVEMSEDVNRVFDRMLTSEESKSSTDGKAKDESAGSAISNEDKMINKKSRLQPLRDRLSQIKDLKDRAQTAKDNLSELDAILSVVKKRIRVPEKGEPEYEDFARVPKRFKNQTSGLPLDEIRDEFNNASLGYDFDSTSEFIDFLEDLDLKMDLLDETIKMGRVPLVTQRETTILKRREKDIKAGIREGRKIGRGEVKTAKQILDRRRMLIRGAQEQFGLDDNDLKKITKKDIRLMTNYEFKLFLEDMYAKSSELAEKREIKNQILFEIQDKELKKTENLIQAFKFPAIDKMSLQQLNEFNAVLAETQKGDEFLSTRKLETVSNTELAGIMTTREAREILAKKLNTTPDKLENIKVGQMDRFRFDASLAEQNPFYRLMVDETNASILDAEQRFFNLEKEVDDLTKKARASRKQGIVDKLIPTDERVFGWLEADSETKKALAKDMTDQEIDLASYLQSRFADFRDYLIQHKALEKYRENYITHIRRGFLETWKEDGLIKAFAEVFEQQKQDEAVFNIMEGDTQNILPLEKFFQFSMSRSGELKPSQNVSKAFKAYSKAFLKKQSLDKLIPALDIYAYALSPTALTPRGLEMDRSLKKFVNEWVNNKKGRTSSLASLVPQGGKIDSVLRGINAFVTMVDLGLNIPVGLSSNVGEQVVTFINMGSESYLKGIQRSMTSKGKKIVSDNRAFVGKSVWDDLSETSDTVADKFGKGIYSLFRISSINANKIHLLGSLTEQEWNDGKISNERKAQLLREIGRYRTVEGAKSIFGSTSTGSTLTKYKSWALPILDRTSRNLYTIARDVRTDGIKAFQTREAQEIFRASMTTALAALIVGGASGAFEDDDSFVGEVVRKAFRESLTFIQAFNPTTYSNVRLLSFLEDLAKALYQIVTLEEYKRQDGYKGIDSLGRIVTPKIVKQLLPSD